ncbi:hypothetical protein Tsubulata_012387 [Turnera subulata]|uniref:KIB1-4 beta-propeller domain-containing protein n=1 Tax=Turnera subulata TaxID=218843 RepID=A0A9Q0FVW7_9ROSI|nr:hypothetical protein Tsubulata_012387 [Turnera subulata]
MRRKVQVTSAEKCSSTVAEWTHIEGILEVIVQKINNISDLIRFGSVCSLWRSVAKHHGRLCLDHQYGRPGFIVSESFDDLHMPQNPQHYIPLSKANLDYQTIKHTLPQLHLSRLKYCFGSYKGWLLALKADGNDSLVVLNPVTGAEILLCHEKYDRYSQIVFSCSPTDPKNFYVLARNRIGGLFYCAPGDERWVHMQIKNLAFEVHGYLDATFYKGKLYAVHESGRILVYDHPITVSSSVPRISQEIRMPPACITPSGSVFPRFPGQQGCGHLYYLVEAGAGLLLAVRKTSRTAYTDRLLSATKAFEVYKLLGGSNNNNNHEWELVKNLGEYALFLGFCQSFALSELKVSGIKGNHIYFLDHYFHIDRRFYDMGVYSLDMNFYSFRETKNFVDPNLSGLPKARLRGMWFIPTPW